MADEMVELDRGVFGKFDEESLLFFIQPSGGMVGGEGGAP